jgi:hypothetical protein
MRPLHHPQQGAAATFVVLLLATLGITGAICYVMMPAEGFTNKYIVGFAFVFLAEVLTLGGPVLERLLPDRPRAGMAFFFQQGYVVGIYATLVVVLSIAAIATHIGWEWLLTLHLGALLGCFLMGGIGHDVGEYASHEHQAREAQGTAMEEIRRAYDLAEAETVRLPADAQTALRPLFYQTRQQLRDAATRSAPGVEAPEAALREAIARLRGHLQGGQPSADAAAAGTVVAVQPAADPVAAVQPLLREIAAQIATREAILKHTQ